MVINQGHAGTQRESKGYVKKRKEKHKSEVSKAGKPPVVGIFCVAKTQDDSILHSRPRKRKKRNNHVTE